MVPVTMSLKTSILKLYFGIENVWYGALDFLEKKLRLPVYKTFIDPVEKAGVPSLPIYFLIAVLALAGAYFLLGPQPTGVASFTIIVQAGGAPVSGLTVTIEGAGLSFSQETTDAGVARFEALPLIEGLTLTIARGDKVLVERPLDLRERRLLRIDLETELSATTTMVVSSVSGFIEGATVSYTTPRGQASAVTDALGEAKLQALVDEEVSYTVSKGSFFDETGSFTAQKDKSVQVFLRSLQPTPPPLTEEDNAALAAQSQRPEFGIVTVRVKDKDTNQGITALVKLRRAEDNSLINESVADKGTAVFSRVKIDTQVYAFASALNYVYDISSNVTVEEETEIALSLEKAPGLTNASNATNTTITVNANGTGYPGANVSIFVTQNETTDYSAFALLDTFITGTGGRVNAVLLKNRYYYAVASAQGHFVEVTSIFQAGQNQNLTLIPITPENAASLAVTALNSQTGGTLAGARITLKNSNGAQLRQDTTASDGRIVFLELKRGVFLSVFAAIDFSGTWTGTASTNLSTALNSVNVTLYPPQGTIVVKAVNNSNSNQTIPASFQAFQDGEVVGSCPVTVSCNMTLPALIPTEIRASPSTPGVLGNSITGVSLLKDEVRSVSIPVFTVAEICGCGSQCGYDPTQVDPTRNFDPPLCVRILGPPVVRDERGYTVTQMQIGKSYTLEFRVASLGAHTTGLYIRVGDAATVNNDYAFLSGADLANVNTSRIFAIRGSQYYQPPDDTYCTTHPYLDVVNTKRILNEEANAFKWLEIEVANNNVTAAQTFAIPFKQIVFVPKTGEISTTLSIYYRAWARRAANATGGTNGTLQDYYRRAPVDYDLAFNGAYETTIDLPAWNAGENP